ncbi:helix-turn-helix transcriptional regulator [Virgibacillus pantothenticus]|uniref:helix-turn-helix transcriptional regulator n=1 Tax=Virgibacillus pantothenticus TaxID=1473 RepID=UPI001BAEBC6B|nr:AraC family transcriptional regulator [Virgibacillus pantothenticus]
MYRQKGYINSYVLSPSVKKCLFEIIHCPYQGMIKKIFIEAKVMELITLYLRDELHCNDHFKPSLHTKDTKKLHQARDIVINNLDDPYSIKDLAKIIGLNEFKLKNGFKQLFGKTIFSLIRSERMEKAALMMEEGYNVSETGTFIGYSNLSNFTVTFRKHFGCNPSEYLKHIKVRQSF